jgi:antitoxin component YwqK of YwqJK toxin-antitoxin module
MKNLVHILLFLMLGCSLAWAQEGNAGVYENGQAKSQGELQNGKKSGEWKYFHDNGQVMREGIFQNGEPAGLWKEYYRSGQVKSEGKYVLVNGNGLKQGLWTTYHKNGAKEFVGKYEQGKQVGTWFEYNTLGIEVHKTVH